MSFNSRPIAADIRAALSAVPARPENRAAILRALAPVLSSHGLPPVSYLGAVNHSSKTKKGEALNIAQFTVYLAPHTSGGAGTVCPGATPGCIASCLHYSGRASFDQKIPAARIARTVFFHGARAHFSAVLFSEIAAAERRAVRTASRLFVRINGTSDISPRAFKVDGVDVLAAFPHLSFFDYTKVWTRAALKWPENYFLCFSWMDGKTWLEALEILKNGHSLAVPFADMGPNGRPKIARSAVLPSTFGQVDAAGRSLWAFPVIDGDTFDARPLDRSEGGAPAAGGYIVGLRAKRSTVDGERAALASGFFVPV